MRNLIICALLAILILLLFSCGTRKTDISYQKQFKDSITIENHYTQATKTVLMDVFTAKPIDALKPMWIDGKEYKNAIVSGSNSKETSKTITKLQKVYVNHYFTITKTKQTQKTDVSNLYIGLFIVFCFFVFAYFKKWF